MPRKKQNAPRERKGKKSSLNEKDALSYEQQIADKSKQLARLHSRNEELENEARSVKEKLERLEEDHADVIAYLKRRLDEKDEEAQELNERLLALDETRKQESMAHKKREESLEMEYQSMKNNLNAEIKLAVGKLNALEDWKIARQDLTRKFEEQERNMKEQEAYYQNLLQETEKKLIIKKTRMKEEMTTRLNELAQRFQEVANIHISDATHRAIKENIVLTRNLNNLHKMYRELEKAATESKKSQHRLLLQSNLLEMETKYTMHKSLKQESTIAELVKRCIAMNLECSEQQRAEALSRSRSKAVEDLTTQYEKLREKNKMYEHRLERIRENYEHVLTDISFCYTKYNKLCGILHEMKESMIEALELQEEVGSDNVCTVCNNTTKESILRTMLNILEYESVEDMVGSQLDAEIYDKMICGE